MSKSGRTSEPARSPVISRRGLLCAGGLGLMGLNLANLLEAETTAPKPGTGNAPRSPIKSCILMFYYGGPSHHDTWDMKPAARQSHLILSHY
jgi:hypothetical protein